MTIHAGPGACAHCGAAPGAKCAKRRIHKKGWRPQCVIEREEAFEALEVGLASVFRQLADADARLVRMARLEALRRQQRRDLAIETCVWVLVIAVLAGFAWLHLYH